MANQKYKFELTAIDKTKAAFNSVKKGLSGVSKFGLGAAATITKVGLAATAASAAVALVAKKSFDFADAIGKVATRTGLSTDTVQAFQIAAVEAGVDIEVANKSLEKFTSSIGDAAKGLKTQRDILDDLGVELKNADGSFKSTDEVLRDVSDGIAGLSSEFEKTSVGAALFGRAGRQVMDVLDDGGAAFDAYIDKARQYGLLLGESGIKQSEKFNDTLALIGRQIKVATAAVSIAFLPILQDLSTRFSTLIANFTGGETGVEEFGNAIRDVAVEKFVGFIDGIAAIADAIHQFRIDIKTFTTDMENAFIQAKIGILEAERKLLILPKAIEMNQSKIEDLQRGIHLNNVELEMFGNHNKSAGDSIRAFGDTMEKYFNEVFGEGSDQTNNFLENYNKVLEAIEGTETTDQQSPLAVLKKDFEDVNKLIETSTVNAIKGMEDALVNFVMTGKSSFKDLVNSIIQDLVRIQIRKSLEGSFDFFSTGLSSLFGKRALGGHVTAGKPYIVGEKGAEMFVPNSSGTIVPNNQMGMSAPSVNFTIQATDASGFDELLVSRKNQIVAMISQAMNQKGKVGLI
jgi:hypothetical protein